MTLFSSQLRRCAKPFGSRFGPALLVIWLAEACSESPNHTVDEPAIEATSLDTSDSEAAAGDVEVSAEDAPDVAETGASEHGDSTSDSTAHALEEGPARTREKAGKGLEDHRGDVPADGLQPARTRQVRRPPPRGTLPDFYDSAEAERLDQLWTRPGVTVVMARRRPFDGVIEVATERVPDEPTATQRRQEFARLGFEAWPPMPRPELSPMGDPTLRGCPFLFTDERTGLPFNPSLDSKPKRGVVVCAKDIDELEALVRGNIATAVAIKRAAPCRELARVDPDSPAKLISAKGTGSKTGSGATDGDDKAGSPAAKATGEQATPIRYSRQSLQAMRMICRDIRDMFALGYPFRTAPIDP